MMVHCIDSVPGTILLLVLAAHTLIAYQVVCSFSIQQSTRFLHHQNNRRCSSILIRQATSSSDLKQIDERNTTGIVNGEAAAAARPTKKKFGKDSVVTRLKQAAIRASAEARRKDELGMVDMKSASTKKPAVTLRQLTAEIDAQLQHALPWEQYQAQIMYRNQRQQFHNQRHQLLLSSLPRDSMAAIVTHNYQHRMLMNGSQTTTAAGETIVVTHEPNVNMTTTITTVQQISAATYLQATIRHVAIVLTKKSMTSSEGKRVLSVETAGRIDRLIQAILHEMYVPHVVAFVGERHADSMDRLNSSQEDNVTSDGDLAYEYFKAKMEVSNTANPVNISSVTYHIERSGTSSVALGNIATYIQQNQIKQWLDEAVCQSDDFSVKATTTPNNNSIVVIPFHQQRRRWKLHVQFALISSDYHLCILNDIHARSPGQSSLRCLNHWTLSSILRNVTVDTSRPSNFYSGIQLETSWTYLYSLTASISRQRFKLLSETHNDDINIADDSHIAIALFASNCYRRAQDLIPVLCNLRGIVANTEFFQRENYHVLVQARRSLVSDMERLYQQQPSLAAIHKVQTPLQQSPLDTRTLSTINSANETSARFNQHNRKSLDVVLEGALLSLGRCLDLVRPAGLLTGSVPAQDFKLALMVLDQAVMQIILACDPDYPLPID